jgi:LmbE family N-acetylglucosaminyl deacetylase
VNVLVVAAHPDDELLGAGGTVARHVAQGDRVTAAILCQSRSLRSSPDSPSEVARQAREAAKILGVSELVMGSLPDQQADTVPLADVILEVEKLIEACQPETIYTHFAGDINRDHQIIAEAVLVAARPYAAPTVREILMFETPSATEWSSPALTPSFQPNVYVDITEFLERKIQAFCCYSAEVRTAPHPRSPAALADRARYWGSLVNRPGAEVFMLVRSTR